MKDLLTRLMGIGTDTEKTLNYFMQDRAMYEKYLRSFPQEKTMPLLTEAVLKKDYAQAEKLVHTLKGIVLSLGFTPLSDACVDMLEELRAGNIPDALDAFGDVEKEYERFCRVITVAEEER